MDKNDIVEVVHNKQHKFVRLIVFLDNFKDPKYVFKNEYGEFVFVEKYEIIGVVDTIENFCRKCLVKVTCDKEKQVLICYNDRVVMGHP